MSVKINIPHLFQSSTNGVKEARVNGNTVGECLKDLVMQFSQFEEQLFDKDGKLLKHIDVYINRESTYPEELTKPVNDGDEIHIVKLISGG